MSTVLGFSLCGVISEAKRIIRAHNRHFLALSLLFLFPLCFSSVIYASLYADPTRPAPLLVTLLFNLFALCFTPCALGTITYSTFHAFYGAPVTLASSIKSLFHSFFPLLSTLIVSQTIFLLIGIVFGIFAAILLTGLQSFNLERNFNLDYNSISFWGLVILLVFVLLPVVLWVQVNWSLAYVIVVVESKWGCEPLRRSAGLVKGKRRVTLFVLLYYGLWSLFTVLGMLGAARWDSGWTKVVMVILYTFVEGVVMLQALAVNVVMYIYCNGEGRLVEIGEEEGYVSLPFDNAKVSDELV